MAEKDDKKELKQALVAWFKQSRMSLVDFARWMDYGYQYAWNLIRGNAPVTDALLGRFAQIFGPEETEKLLTLAGYDRKAVDVLNLGASRGQSVKGE